MGWSNVKAGLSRNWTGWMNIDLKSWVVCTIASARFFFSFFSFIGHWSPLCAALYFHTSAPGFALGVLVIVMLRL